MRIFIIHSLQFLAIPIICLFLSFLINSEIEKKRELLNLSSERHNLIIMGDSKSVVSYNYKLLKENFPNYNIINISLWGENPQFNYSVYQNLLKNKNLSNSIVVYNSTYRHLLNKSNKEWEKWNLKEKVDDLLGKTYKFKHTKSENGFINILKQDFKDKRVGIEFYKSLEDEYSADFSTQMQYIVKFKRLIENGNNNKFLICELPYDSVVQNIYEESTTYYHLYREAIFTEFNTEGLYFNYMQELDDRKYWFDHNHLHDRGARIFTPIFCDSLRGKIKQP
jgi:hypothetical protein